MSGKLKKFTTLTVILFTMIAGVSVTIADLEIPQVANRGFIQTSGPNQGINRGDWWSNDEGENVSHRLTVNIPCLLTEVTYFFDLFDPEVNIDSTPLVGQPGYFPDAVLDEPLPNVLSNANADDTEFTLYAPDGTLVADQVFTPGGGTDYTWVEFHSITLPGDACGEYALEARTLDNDDNAWRFRLRDNNPLGATPVDGSDLGIDRLAGTGDEPWVGLQRVSYQHQPAGDQTFYWFVGDNTTNMYMTNFDMDDNTSVIYTTPSGQAITGTVSGYAEDGPGGTGWNSDPMRDVRPGFGDMQLFDPANGDFEGDAIVDPEPGIWSANVAVEDYNQYSFEVPNQLVFMDPFDPPTINIEKDDGRTQVNSPDTVTYTVRIWNTGVGAAMPVPGPEVVDILPPEMTFVSCQINAPLVGTCGESAPGSGTVNVQLEPQANILAYLPGVDAAPDNQGTIQITATVNPGVPEGTQLTNTVRVDLTDVFRHNHAPETDTDTNVVVVPDDPGDDDPGGGDDDDGGSDDDGSGDGDDGSGDDGVIAGQRSTVPGNFPPGSLPDGVSLEDYLLSKTVEPPFALPGEAVLWSVVLTNTSQQTLTDIELVDEVPPLLVLLDASSDAGAVTVDGREVRLRIDRLAPGASVTLAVNTQVSADATLPYEITNRAYLTGPYSGEAFARLLGVTSLPRTGETPWWRTPFILGMPLGMMLLASAGLWVYKQQQAGD